MKKAVFVLIVIMCAGGCADFLPFSSGQLIGTLAAAPNDWRRVAASAEIIQLETRPDDPYSVNLWVLGAQDHLYIFAGDSYTEWVEHIDADPNVRVRIGDSLFSLVATRVTDAAEFERFAQGWEQKYGNRPRNENVDETYLLRLQAR